MLRRISVAAAAAALLLAGCSSTGDDDGAEALSGAGSLLEDHDLTGLEAREVVDRLERLASDERPQFMASVQVDDLLLSDDDGTEVTLPMPADAFYLSVAPYAEQTHECFYHSLTTCQGELDDEQVEVTIRTDDGQVLVDEEVTTFDNGFVGFWLPRNVEGTVEVSHDGRSGAADFGTGVEDPTCLTTLRLS